MVNEIEVWLYSEPALAEVDEGGDVEKRIGGEVAERQPQEDKEVAKERGGRHIEPAGEVVLEDDYLAGVGGREALPPPNGFLGG